MKARVKHIEDRGVLVFSRQQIRLDFCRLVYAYVRIVEANGAVMIGSVEGVDLVENLGIRFQRNKAMRKSGRHKNLVPAIGRQRYSDPYSEVGRNLADVDDNIETEPWATRKSLACAWGGFWRYNPRSVSVPFD